MSALPPLQAPIAGSPSVAADTSRLATKENLEKAAAKFEALFIHQMLKSARAAKLDDGLFDSEALDQFRDMQDAKLAETISVHTPMGIGKALADFLAQNRPDLKGDEPK
ncbi:rod-binding protein [Sphingomonas sp.]|uniref:rod-binding protein n=1 Tax=Sphingomonas sp. TaxID=28214 RepID=UPI002DE7E928|nr:rod-binding protein [Sphingomonas sp.]